MFRKPFKIKSNSQVKGSERKTIREQLLKSFPNLTEYDLETLLPKKQMLHVIKIVTSNEELVQIYAVQKRPIAFIIRDILFPTIYFLWKLPELIPTFSIHPDVFSFISSGADLMLPGVVTPPKQNGLCKYGNLSENEIACVNCTTNKAAVAIGITVQSSVNMELSKGRGKCLTIYHYFGDKLCTLEGMPCLPLINLGPPEWLKFESYDKDFPVLGACYESKEEIEEIVESLQINGDTEVVAENVTNKTQQSESEEMDDLLNYCFFAAIKYSKSLVLPILTSNFYKLQMIPICPKDKCLDLKKSSFKKLKSFLDSMCKIGVITVQEMKKGVETLTVINKEHPKFNEFYIHPDNRPKLENSSANENPSNILESYIITQNVLPIFSEVALKKGKTLQITEIRKVVTDYVKKYDCQDEGNKKLVKMNSALAKLCKTENSITWEELFEKVCGSMKPCYKVSVGNDEFINKGKISPITITVSMRTSNKKVTLIDNLNLFGICITDFAKECQHGVAASTSISRPASSKSDQLLVQGNQVLFVYNLLTEKYKVPKKYIKGLENAPKKKK